MKPKLIVINGLPATGKTTLARKISERTGISAIGKDDIKELLFDNLGIKDKKWSGMLGAASIETLYVLAEQFLSSGQSIIIEAPFWPGFSRPRLEEIVWNNGAEALEIYCRSDPEARQRRGRERDASGKRHPGHDDDYTDASEPELLKRYAPMKLGVLIELDTTHPEDIDIGPIVSKIG